MRLLSPRENARSIRRNDEPKMANRPSTLERAFQLAQTGRFNHVARIKKALRWEGYFDAASQLHSQVVRARLREVCAKAVARQVEANGDSPVLP